MISQGMRREKTGVIKEHFLMSLYRSGDQSPIMTDSEYHSGNLVSLLEAASTGPPISILENPVYKQSMFYPFRNDLRKKEKEKNQRQKSIEDIYTKIRD